MSTATHKPREYCTQPRRAGEGCETCSLTNYGKDCQNNPITQHEAQPKRLRGMDAAMAAYSGHAGQVTVRAVLEQIPQELRDRLTGHELGLVMSAVNAAYHNGRASHGGLDLCDDCVWLPFGGGVEDGKERGQLIPIEALRRIKKDGNHYTLDYTEGA